MSEHRHNIVKLIGVTRYIGDDGLETKTWFLWLNCEDHPTNDVKNSAYIPPCHSTVHDVTVEGSIDFVGQYHFLCEYNDELYYRYEPKESMNPMQAPR